ncbi:hypothetical protein [Lederbergia citrea]|uniref:hypothetical protein n=1 Tax=Lederbergia citrea TaxID=2833581 RepID=UPI001BCA37DE|nr:hypothetical protein [Lederbergia citrea]MBS4176095.1 hypothetical protein [Lederbergia citrea]
MKKNRQILYLFVFLIAVGAMAVYGKSATQEFSPEKVTHYLNNMRLGIQDIYNKVPIDQIREKKTISKGQLDQLIEGSDRIFSSYLELKAIGLEFDYFEDTNAKMETNLENIHTSLYQIKEASNGDTRLIARQIASFSEVYNFLWDLYGLDVYNMDLDEILSEMEKVSENYEPMFETYLF